MTTEELTLNVEKALDEIRPFLNSDGDAQGVFARRGIGANGDITLISIEDDRHVTVRFEGACVGCSVNTMTLKIGVETTIKKFAPQVETVTNIA